MALMAIGVVYALPPTLIQTSIDNHTLAIRADQIERTSFGDSYATGVGAGNYIDGYYRCLRYDQAYPVLMNGIVQAAATSPCSLPHQTVEQWDILHSGPNSALES